MIHKKSLIQQPRPHPVGISCQNLESIDDLIADGSVVMSMDYGEEMKTSSEKIRKKEIGDSITESFTFSMNEIQVDGISHDSITSTARNDCFIRKNPGRRTDLGLVDVKCFSWAGPECENENNEDDDLVQFIGRKGGLI